MKAFTFALIVCVVLLSVNYTEGKSAGTVVSPVLPKKNVLQKRVTRPTHFKIQTRDVNVVADSTTATGPSSKLSQALRLFSLFTVWYAFNAGYNVYNAHLKTDLKFPWTSATLQLWIGLIYAIPLWFFKVRKIPNLTKEDVFRLLPIAFLNAFGHLSAVIAMFQKGGGSFTHVIKASEPVVSVILSLFINGVVPKPFTALSLFPITYGVAYASTLGNINVKTLGKELTSKAAKMAMTSNIALSLRSIFRKNLPKDFKERTNLDPANEHAVTTLLSSLILVPFVLAFENIPQVIESIKQLSDPTRMFKNLFFSGICFYFYNELQNIVLSSLGPVPTAVGNTLKRVVIFVALYLFTQGEEFPPAKILGSAIAILGCFAFAICDSKKI